MIRDSYRVRQATARVRKAWFASLPFRVQREMKRRYIVARASRSSPYLCDGSVSATVCRVIGNDLYPRHQSGQSVSNLRTILEVESNPFGWQKLFILNRFVNHRLQEEALDAVDRAGYACDVIPFEPDIYQSLKYRPELFGGLSYFSSAEFLAKDPFSQDRMRIWACGEKIRYLMNINGARNHALAAGRLASDWTFVLDGSCFIPGDGFTALKNDLERVPSAPYLVVPMRRQSNQDDFAASDFTSVYQEEPQVAFRSDSVEQFDEIYPYGVRDKTSLLHRLGVPGPWCAWAPLAWHSEHANRSRDRYLFQYASTSVLRLTSGIANGALELPKAQMKRYRTRITAIFATLQAVDRQCDAADAADLATIAGSLNAS